MSSIVNKIKDAVSGDKHSEPEGTHGHHNSRAANAADPRIDSDRDHRAGPHNPHTTHTNTHTAGPHNSDVMNKADPRVDSDLDGNRGMPGTHSTHTNTRTAGPHNSDMMNKADPRVDSDLDGNRGMSGHGTHGTHGATGLGVGAMHRNTHNTNTSGPHNSDMMNRVDPRVDSDNSRLHGTHGEHMGATHSRGEYSGVGQHTEGSMGRHSEGQYGTMPHGTTHEANRGTYGGAEGTGPAPHTAGPHKSDMTNKMDPRVDSNLDGSKTVGGNKTFAQSHHHEGNYAHKNPRDAAQVPPSVMQKHIGGPEIMHDDHHHNREGRHNSVSHQEHHTMGRTGM